MADMKLDPTIPLLPFEKPLEKLYKKAAALQSKKQTPATLKSLQTLQDEILAGSKSIYKSLNNWQRTQVSRHPNRPYSLDYVDLIFEDFVELHGDRNFRDDPSTVCGIAQLDGQSVVIVGQQKGRTTEENLKRNFGYPQPEAYRKALRIFHFAQKFNKPIITLIDTPGAFPGLEGEQRSQGEAIARNLKEMAALEVPVIAVVIGEGGSGGALGIGVANHVAMLENAIYSVISPESCASILYRDSDHKETAAKSLRNDAKTALKFAIIDEIIPEAVGGAHRDWETTAANVKKSISKALHKYSRMKSAKLSDHRIAKYAKMGAHIYAA